MNTPIVVFAFNRPWHLDQTLTALAKNHEAASSKIIIYCDGPRNQRDKEAVESTRKIAKNCSGFADTELILRETNYGLSKSIISGVTEQLEINEQIIVLEDDMVTSPYFLKYMNEALTLYANDERVISIHGYIYPVKGVLPETFFLRGADCWGWATWRRGWKYFNSDGRYLLDQLKKQHLISQFDFDGTYKFSQMLKDQIAGRNDSWAIRWYASAFLENKLTLYPGHSLVQNIGNDRSGTHYGNTNKYEVYLANKPLDIRSYLVKPSDVARSQIKAFFMQKRGKKLIINNLLKTFLKAWIPPVVLQIFGRNHSIIFSGNYSSWEAAYNATSGYNTEIILERVKAASLKVKQGEAVYERDSVIFDQIHYSFPILAGLLKVAVEYQGHLSVLDFGGSLGSSYYQCRSFLSGLNSLRWSIVEQPHFVACGQEFFEDEVIKFYENIEICLEYEKPNVILLSSVIQYLEHPYDFLKNLINYKFPYILIDRTAFVESGSARLTIQRVPESIYPASYPAWFLNQNKFLELFLRKYDLIFDFDGSDRVNIPSQFKGFFFKREINAPN